MNELETIYLNLINTPSDINEHLLTLKKYAAKCEHVTEMGVRGIISTWALLAGLPKKMVSYDILHPSIWGGNIDYVYKVASDHNVQFDFILSDVLKVEIEETDLLFIDTWHSYKQLKAELKLHAKYVRKYICFHDTTSYETDDENSYQHLGDEWKPEGIGIWKAIEEFLQDNPNWKLEARFTNNNGFTIIKKDVTYEN